MPFTGQGGELYYTFALVFVDQTESDEEEEDEEDTENRKAKKRKMDEIKSPKDERKVSNTSPCRGVHDKTYNRLSPV